MDPEQLRGLVAMGTDTGPQAEAVQRLLELPLASASAPVPLPASAEDAAAEGSSAEGAVERTSTGRRRRASSPPAADGADVVRCSPHSAHMHPFQVAHHPRCKPPCSLCWMAVNRL